MNAETQKYVKIGILAASVVMILSTVLPYVSVFGFSISLLFTDGSQIGDGAILIVFAVLCIVFTLINKALPELVVSAVALIMAFYEASQLGQFGMLVSKEIGFYLMLLSSIVLLAASIMNFLASRKNA